MADPNELRDSQCFSNRLAQRRQELPDALRPRENLPAIVAIDIDGVIRPLIKSITELKKALEADVANSYGKMTPAQQQAKRNTKRQQLLDLFGTAVGDQQLEKFVENSVHHSHLRLPEGETIDSVLGRMSEVALLVTAEHWAVNRYHRSWDNFSYLDDNKLIVPADVEMHIVINPWVGRWVRSLQKRGIEVCWSTSWSQTANCYFAPLLQIDPMETPVNVYDQHGSGGASITQWKERAAVWRYPDTPIAYIDDEYFGNSVSGFVDGPQDQFLKVSTNKYFGLQPSDAVVVENWLATQVSGFVALSAPEITQLESEPYAEDARQA